jgi:predicted nucleic acid-binding protein
LSRGARSREMRRFVDGLTKNLRIIAPTEKEWIESGKIICHLMAEHGYDVNETRQIHFDVLIALTARRIGAYLITCNSKDFIAIQRYVGVELICW